MRILICYPKYPEYDTNSGAYRLVAVLKLLLADGHKLTFLAEHGNDVRYRQALEALGIVCTCVPPTESTGPAFGRFLREGAFEAAVFVHHQIYYEYSATVRAYLPGCRMVLDTVDLHHVRVAREAELSGDPAKAAVAERTRKEELAAVADSDQVWVVTEPERETLGRLVPGKQIVVIPNVHEILEAPPGRDERSGVVFLGGYQHQPNVDAVHFFMNEVAPALGADVPITLAGSDPPDEVKAYSSPPRIVVPGYVPDHRALLKTHRVGVVPLRYGAGMKGKLGEYLACGLPCVSTSIGAEGMHLVDGSTVLAADDPAEFARAVARLYHDVALWNRLSAAGRLHIDQTLSPRAIAPAVRHAITELGAARPHRLPVAGRMLRAFLNPRRWSKWAGTAYRSVREGGGAQLAAKVRLWAQGR